MADGQCGRESKHLAPDDETDAVERTAEHALEDRPYQEKLGSPDRRGKTMQELAIVCCLIPNKRAFHSSLVNSHPMVGKVSCATGERCWTWTGAAAVLKMRIRES